MALSEGLFVDISAPFYPVPLQQCKFKVVAWPGPNDAPDNINIFWQRIFLLNLEKLFRLRFLSLEKELVTFWHTDGVLAWYRSITPLNDRS